MKKIALLIIAVLTTISAFCLPQNSRQPNTIYVLDCTASMTGYHGAQNIWGPTKNFLKAELEKSAKETPGAKALILPFQEKVLTPISVNLQNLSWPQIEAALDQYVLKPTDTNICDAWLKAETYVGDPSYDNFIILLTDGHDNIGGAANEPQRVQRLAEILSAFCGKYENTQGMYVELTDQATLPAEIKSAIDRCASLQSINASEGIPSFGSFVKDSVEINTRELPKDIAIGFSNAGTFQAVVDAAKNQFVDISIKGNKIKGGKAVIHIESKFGKDIEALNNAISASETTIPITINSSEVNILNPDIDVILCAKPIRSLDITAKDGVLSASVKRVKPFLWIKGEPFDTLRWEMHPAFSEEAQRDNSRAQFRIQASQDMSDYTILFNGNVLIDSIITITPGVDAVVEVVIPQSMKDNRISLVLKKVRSKNLDLINGERTDNAPIITLEGEYATSWSWLEKIVWAILILVVLFLILWYALIRKLKYPTFSKGVINIQSPYFAAIRVKGARKVVLGNKAKKQGLFDKVWRGRVIYHANAVWPCDVEITPTGKNMRFRCPSGQLISDPSPLLRRGEVYKFVNTSDNSKIDININ
jgi:hypothetical protein